jgi:hypothetical protein
MPITDANGNVNIAISQLGQHLITVGAGGYNTVSDPVNVTSNGQLFTEELTPLTIPYSINVHAQDKVTGKPIAGAQASVD